MIRIETAIKLLLQYYEIAKNNDWIRDKVTWALYQTWKEADQKGGKNVHMDESHTR